MFSVVVMFTVSIYPLIQLSHANNEKYAYTWLFMPLEMYKNQIIHTKLKNIIDCLHNTLFR